MTIWRVLLQKKEEFPQLVPEEHHDWSKQTFYKKQNKNKTVRVHLLEMKLFTFPVKFWGNGAVTPFWDRKTGR